MWWVASVFARPWASVRSRNRVARSRPVHALTRPFYSRDTSDYPPKRICLSKATTAAVSGGLLAGLLSGCYLDGLGPTTRQPDRLYPTDQEIGWVRAYLDNQNDLMTRYISSPDVLTRNTIITARMYAIDVLYTKYESQLTHENQDVSFGATAVQLGLTTTASLIPVAQTTRLLSGIASGVNGLDTAMKRFC
jgi:hypothetical protein